MYSLTQVNVDGKYTSVKDVQFENALFPIVVTPSGTYISYKISIIKCTA